MNLETARYYSGIIGDVTILQISTSGKGNSKSKSKTLKGHLSILFSDTIQLTKNHAIVFYAKENPAKTSFILWCQNHSFPTIKVSNKLLTLINFNQDYYYDIKTSIIKNLFLLKRTKKLKKNLVQKTKLLKK